MLSPGRTIGMLGGGQLGRMTLLAARAMGYRSLVLEPGADGPAAQVADEHINAAYTDPGALRRLLRDADVITFEFENLPVSSLEQLSVSLATRPGPHVLHVTQDRVREKQFAQQCGLEVTTFAAIERPEALSEAVEHVGFPAILKTSRLGYDGKGQVRLPAGPDELARLTDAWQTLQRQPCILERLVPFERELSVVVVRDVYGNTHAYPAAENVHVGGILDSSTVPALLPEGVAQRAQRQAETLARALKLVGVLAVEYFVCSDGRLLINELAPRPHNSGHWSIEACATSQFEQQVRTTIGAKAGDTTLNSPACTVNLLGELWEGGAPDWEALLDRSDVHLHLYGKKEARPGRKMGHITVLADSPERARTRALEARALLTRGRTP